MLRQGSNLPPGRSLKAFNPGGLPAGIDAARAKHSEAPKLSVHFAVDPSGLLQVTKGEAVFETTEEYTVKVSFRTRGSEGITPHTVCVSSCTTRAVGPFLGTALLAQSQDCRRAGSGAVQILRDHLRTCQKLQSSDHP